MPVMDVRPMSVDVGDLFMDMKMFMRLRGFPRVMLVPVMLIMHVPVCVRDCLMGVKVPMDLLEQQEHARHHQKCSEPEDS